MMIDSLLKDFYCTLSVSDKTLKFKQKWLKHFCNYIEKTMNLVPGSWNFDKVYEHSYGDLPVRLPIDSYIVAKFMSSIKEVSDRTYNDILVTIKQFFDHLIDIGILYENPAIEVKHRKTFTKDTSDMHLTLDEAILLLAGSILYNEHVHRNFCLTLLFLSSATRIGEANGMAIEDLKFENNLIYVSGKTRKRRRFMTPGLSVAFVDLLNDPLRLKALQGQDNVFYSDKGGPLTTDQANSLLKEFAKIVGIHKNLTTYYLRRTFARILFNNNFSLKEIQEIFHHSNIENTAIYVGIFKSKILYQMIQSSPTEGHLENLTRTYAIKPTTIGW